MSVPPRAQLIHIDVDRRLGHEWDEWDGKPLPNHGDYDSSPRLFFVWSALTLVAGGGLAAFLIYILNPRLGLIDPAVPGILWGGWALGGLVLGGWWLLMALGYVLKRPVLPERLAERGPFLRLMRFTSGVANRFGRRDWVENSAVKVYNALAVMRGRKVGKG